MIGRQTQVKLSILAQMTGFGYSTLRSAGFAEWKRGCWVASLEQYESWLNGEKGKRRGDDQEDGLGEVPSSSDGERGLDQRPKRGEAFGRAQGSSNKKKATQYAWVTDNGVELGVEAHQRNGSQ